MYYKKLSAFPRIAFLLYALSPLIENIDCLYYINSFLIIALFIVSVIGYGKIYKKNKAYFLKYLIGSTIDNLYDLAIAITGIGISYFMHLNNRAYFWWFILILTIIELLFPAKIIVKDKEK